MERININLTFDKDFLSKLVSDENASVQVYKKTYHIGLHPFHLINLNSSIKEILNDKIAKYDQTFDGILLGYQNIKLLDSAGAINFDSCFVHINIEADFYIFKPTVGQILNGAVNKKSKDHVGCLVHKTFNISLPKPENCEEWIGFSAQIGQEIQFEVIFADLHGKLPYIKGKILSLSSDDSGFSTSDEPNGQRNTITTFIDDTEVPHESAAQKKRKRESSSSSSETETKTGKNKHGYYKESQKYNNEISKSHKKHKHKDKKKKEINENILQGCSDNDDLAVDINDTIVKKKRKHKKKVDMDEECGDTNIEANVSEKQYQQNFPVSLEKKISASSNHNDVKTKKKKKKDRYMQEDDVRNIVSNLNTEENLEKRHKKKKHKHGKESEAEVLISNVSTESEVLLKREGKRHSEEYNECQNTLNNLNSNENVARKHKNKKHKHRNESEAGIRISNVSAESEVLLKHVEKIHSAEENSERKHKKKKHKDGKELEAGIQVTNMCTKSEVSLKLDGKRHYAEEIPRDTEYELKTLVKKKKKKKNYK